jgi:hypothetical protein
MVPYIGTCEFVFQAFCTLGCPFSATVNISVPFLPTNNGIACPITMNTASSFNVNAAAYTLSSSAKIECLQAGSAVYSAGIWLWNVSGSFRSN